MKNWCLILSWYIYKLFKKLKIHFLPPLLFPRSPPLDDFAAFLISASLSLWAALPPRFLELLLTFWAALYAISAALLAGDELGICCCCPFLRSKRPLSNLPCLSLSFSVYLPFGYYWAHLRGEVRTTVGWLPRRAWRSVRELPDLPAGGACAAPRDGCLDFEPVWLLKEESLRTSADVVDTRSWPPRPCLLKWAFFGEGDFFPGIGDVKPASAVKSRNDVWAAYFTFMRSSSSDFSSVSFAACSFFSSSSFFAFSARSRSR